METVKQIAACVLGTVAFAVTMRAPRKSLKLIFCGSVICATAERIITKKHSEFVACLAAMLMLFLFCEITARITKQPTTVILTPAVIPLLPGSSIYYTMLYAIQGNGKLTTQYAKSTLYAGLGIAMGAVIGEAVIKLINAKKAE